MFRSWQAALIKVPMLWTKTSLFAVTFDNLTDSEKASMSFAIFLGWYALAPLFEAVPGIWRVYKMDLRQFKNGNFERGPWLFLIPLPFVFLMIVFLHFCGIFLCDSHDLSVLHGCT